MIKVDFYKGLGLPAPIVTGLVNKITSPKGKRKFNEELGQYEYHLNDELLGIYDQKPMLLPEGIYWVMEIHKNHHNELKWNHYLVVLNADEYYAVAEFLGCKDSTWIVDALPYIKEYFAGNELEPIDITPYKAPKHESRWGRYKN